MNLLQQAELDEWEGGLSEENQEEMKQRFQIKDLSSLNWAFSKLAALQAKESEIVHFVKAEKERFEKWEAQQITSIKKDMEFFEGLITHYHAQVLQSDPKAKTLSTPYGKSKSITRKAQAEKVDDKQILRHVIENELAYTKPVLEWGEFKKSLKIVEVNGLSRCVDENGEIVPGVGVTEAGTSFKAVIEP